MKNKIKKGQGCDRATQGTKQGEERQKTKVGNEGELTEKKTKEKERKTGGVGEKGGCGGS